MVLEKIPARVETERLVLRRPLASDADAVFSRYASDPDVVRFVGFPAHRSLDDTRAFIAASDDQWERWPCGPYLIESRADGRLLGGTGLTFETPRRAMTGYVLAKDCWGRGHATEALRAIVALADRFRVTRVYALCHPAHAPSAHVLEKCGFAFEGVLRAYAEFPNLQPGEPLDASCYSRILGDR
jgi:[ribosomal protein S5]-alanine N-acetyltransferase